MEGGDAASRVIVTPTSSARAPSAIRKLGPLTKLPGMLNLGGGMPNPATFPFKKLDVELTTGESFSLSGDELNACLQYSNSAGLPVLTDWLHEHMKNTHAPPNAVSICVTTGSQDAQCKAFDMLFARGDAVLCEEPSYSGALAALKPLGVSFVPVATDASGLVPSSLRARLASWDAEDAGAPRPRVLYTIPTGQNPSGATLPAARKREVYDICREYDVLILEDDPYFHLQFQFENNVTTSFLNLDVDGRVLRFDSFSKILSSGLRLGWVTGPAALVDRIVLHQQVSTLHTSGLSQGIVGALLNKWGHDGFAKHLESVQRFYLARRDKFVAAAKEVLGDVTTFAVPDAGMFVWFNISGIEDSQAVVEETAVAKKVVCVPGKAFSVEHGPSTCVRASFSMIPENDMHEALSRLRAAILEAKEGSQ